jgi:hypothetical protein
MVQIFLTAEALLDGPAGTEQKDLFLIFGGETKILAMGTDAGRDVSIQGVDDIFDSTF